MMKKRKYQVVISGSFGKAFEEIMKAVEEFEKAGFEVLAPKKSKIINPGEEFVVLEGEEADSPKMIGDRYLKAISEADILYLVTPKGYLGNSAKMELGFALALHKHIYCSEVVDDATLKLYCGEKATPSEVAKRLAT